MSIKFLTVILSLMVGAVPHAAVALTPNHELIIPRIASPRIDGDISDLGWTMVSQKNGKIVIDLESNGYGRLQHPRIAYVGYDGEALYACVIDIWPIPRKAAAATQPTTQPRLRNPTDVLQPAASGAGTGTANPKDEGPKADLITKAPRRAASTDVVELYIQPDQANGGFYVQVSVTADGQLEVMSADRKKRDEKLIQYSVRHEGLFWYTEIAVPFEFLGVAAPKEQDRWGFNVCGRQMAATHGASAWITWNPTYGGFHNTRRFATMIFGK